MSITTLPGDDRARLQPPRRLALNEADEGLQVDRLVADLVDEGHLPGEVLEATP